MYLPKQMLSDNHSATTSLWKPAVIIAFLIWMYIAYRAFTLAVTQDEAHTYLLAKTDNWRQMFGTANTHWMNTLFLRAMLLLPGYDAMWKLRLLSVLSWAVYAFSCIKLTACFKRRWYAFVFFLAAMGNPFLIFYFSLSRGYAAACAFIMLTLWLALRLVEANEIKPVRWTPVFLMAAVAVLANFSAFYFFIALLSCYLLLLLDKRSIQLLFRRSGLPLLAILSAVSFFSIQSLWFIKGHNDLGFGGKEHVVHSLFGSTIESFSYLDNHLTRYQAEGVPYLLADELPPGSRLTGWVLFATVAVFIAYTCYRYYSNKAFPRGAFPVLITGVIVVLNIVLHHLFNTPYLQERTALILFPPLVVGLFMLAEDKVEEASWSKYFFYPVSGILLFVLVFNFYRGFSLKYFSDWPVQVDTQSCLDYLESSQAKEVGMSVWHHDVLINYYAYAYPGKYHFKATIIPDKFVNGSDARALLSFDHLLKCPPHYDSLTLKNWTLKLNYPISGARVYKRKIAR